MKSAIFPRITGLFAALALSGLAPVQGAVTSSLVDKIQYRFLTENPRFCDFRAVFSPDGQHLVFEHAPIAAKPDQIRLFTMSVHGGELHPLLPSSFPHASTRAAWSRANGAIAFNSQGDGGQHLYIVRPNGSNPVKIKSERLTDNINYPHWYPDGLSIVLVDYNRSSGSGSDGIVKKVTPNLAEPDHPEVTFLTDPATFYGGEPAISPDGRYIAIAGQPNDGKKYNQANNCIWILDLRDNRLSRFDGKEGRAPSWSPDGKWLTFESNRSSLTGGQYAIYAKRFPDGARLYQLTPYGFNAQHCAWSNNGQFMAVSAQLEAIPPQGKPPKIAAPRGIVVFRVPPQLRP